MLRTEINTVLFPKFDIKMETDLGPEYNYLVDTEEAVQDVAFIVND